MGEFAKLDPLLHSELRLAVMSTLLTMEEADFVYLREATGATAGNLGFAGKKPRTVCRITETGARAFAAYVEALKSYLH